MGWVIRLLRWRPLRAVLCHWRSPLAALGNRNVWPALRRLQNRVHGGRMPPAMPPPGFMFSDRTRWDRFLNAMFGRAWR